MPRYLVLALSGPTDGEEAERRYNDWYDDAHLPALRKVDGVVSARRFRVVQGSVPQPYVAAYEIETDDLAAAMKGMTATMGDMPDAFDRANSGNLVAVEITK